MVAISFLIARFGIILGWISRRWDVGIWTGLGWPRIETGGGRSGSVKCGEFLD